MEKRYRVDFYNMFDGWISNYLKETENDFDTIEEATIDRDKKNSELPESNKKCDEHYGVIVVKFKNIYIKIEGYVYGENRSDRTW